MKQYLFFIALFLNLISYSQQDSLKKLSDGRYGNMISFKDCNDKVFVIDDGSFGIRYPYKGGVNKFFSNAVKRADVESFNGKVMIQIILSPNGKTCCKAISKISGNFSLSQLDSLNLEKYINLMPKWIISKPMKKFVPKGTTLHYSILIDLEFNDSKGIQAKYRFMKLKTSV